MLDNGDILTTSKLYGFERDIHKGTNQSNPIIKRANKDADLGLKALAKMGYDAFDKDKGITNDDRWWFMFEDQTYGCLAVADMVNRGKTKKQILDLLNQVNIDEPSDGMFELNEFYRSGAHKTNYIDECINVKNSGRKRHE